MEVTGHVTSSTVHARTIQERYFDQDNKKDVISRVHDILRPGGYMFLGGAETTIGLSDSFERTSFDGAGCFQKTKTERI